MIEIKADPDGCEEASQFSTEMYIPCNAPATRIVTFEREGPYRMCGMCAFHNIKKRGAQDLGAYEPRVGVAE